MNIIIIHPVVGFHPLQKADFQNLSLEEAIGLARALDLNIVETSLIHLDKPHPATFMKSGKVGELKEKIKEHDVHILFIDHNLSPVQQRNLERSLQCKVIDRTGIIIEIFAKRARTAEGRLQVELASVTYQRSRLVKTWTHLERQRGGFGFLGGPGESQLEMDRRMLDMRIESLKKSLDHVKRTRSLQRQSRKRSGKVTIALVGYTNAGKSTLLNRLSNANVLAKDMLFATLDPTLRVIKLSQNYEAILCDTVGFISNLPTQLVNAFHATLEEILESDIILHVQDISHPFYDHQKKCVIDVLKEIGVDDHMLNDQVIDVFNKYDLLSDDQKTFFDNSCASQNAICLSAQTGRGIDNLLRKIVELADKNSKVFTLKIHVSQGEDLAWLYDNTNILKRKDKGENITLTFRIQDLKIGPLKSRFPQLRDTLEEF